MAVAFSCIEPITTSIVLRKTTRSPSGGTFTKGKRNK